MFDLLFENKKISSLSELMDNYEPETVRLYYLGGSLVQWLMRRGEAETAEKVAGIDPEGDIDRELALIFGQPFPIKADIQTAQAVYNYENALARTISSFSPFGYAVSAKSGYPLGQYAWLSSQSECNTERAGSFAVDSSFGSFGDSFSGNFGSFASAVGFGGSFTNESNSFFFEHSSFSFGTGSFGISALYASSGYYGAFGLGGSFGSYGSFGSFGAFLSYGSFGFNMTSFSYKTAYTTPFGIGSYLYGSLSGSYYGGSFGETSFSFSSFNSSSFDTGNYFSSGNSELISSFSAANGDVPTSSAELNRNIFIKTDDRPIEERIKENLSLSPLNRFGYGIHLV